MHDRKSRQARRDVMPLYTLRRVACLINAAGIGDDRKGWLFRMAPRAHGDDPHFLEIIRRELRQKLEFDNVLVKCLLIHTQTEIMEPGRDVHAHIPLAVGAA